MAHTAYTAKLTPSWDLQLNKEGNISTVTGPLSIAQNFANELRLWTNDAFYQIENGIDWKEVQLAKTLDSGVLIQIIKETGLRTAGVKTVDNVEIQEVDTENRILHGNITFTTEQNQVQTFNF
jgi:hypothetical protein